MLFTGVGGNWSPDCPRIDVLISSRLKRRGFEGTRDETVCLYASTLKSQALDYAKDGDESHLKIVEPQSGSVISWVPGLSDMLLDFGSHLSDMYWGGVHHYRGLKFGALVRDIAGDLDIAETYLSLGRQKRALGAMVDSYLDRVDVREIKIAGCPDIAEVIGEHEGEVWITGPCLVHDYEPSLHDIPTRRPLSSPSFG